MFPEDFFLDFVLAAPEMVESFNIDNINNMFFSLSNSAVWFFSSFGMHQTGPVVLKYTS